MSFGLGIYKPNGVRSFSSTDVTWNQVDFFQVDGNSSAYKNYPILAGRESLLVQLMIDPPPLDRRAIAHTTSVSGTNVTVSGGSEKAYILVLMR